jgi:hypothetical protein
MRHDNHNGHNILITKNKVWAGDAWQGDAWQANNTFEDILMHGEQVCLACLIFHLHLPSV